MNFDVSDEKNVNWRLTGWSCFCVTMCLFPVRVDEKMKENENPSVLKTQKMWIENKNKTKKTKAKAKTFGSTNQTERKKEIQEEDYGRIYKLFRERRRKRKSDILIFLISNF